MRSIEIPYGRGRQIFHIEDHRLTGVLMPETMPKAGEETETVRRAISAPIDSARLSTLSQTAERILLITSDHTRPVPSRITLPLLLEEIREGNPKAEITILIATGLHRATTRQEMEQKFGKSWLMKSILLFMMQGQTTKWRILVCCRPAAACDSMQSFGKQI